LVAERLMRLVSWNVQGTANPTKIGNQVAAVLQRQPDVIAFQDISGRGAAVYLRELAAGGLANGLASIGADSVRPPSTVGVFRGVLIASRWPIAGLVEGCRLPLPERGLAVTLATPFGPLAVYTVYVPNPFGRTKAETDVRRAGQVAVLEMLYAQLIRPRKTHRIVCGDFNVTDLGRFGQLQDVDLHEVHGLLRPDAHAEVSFHGPGLRFAYRLDYVLASSTLRPVESQFLHQFGRHLLSDHSPQEVTFAVDRATARVGDSTASPINRSVRSLRTIARRLWRERRSARSTDR
jgi:exonuclease III